MLRGLAILSAQNSGKPLGGRSSAAPNPAGALTALPILPSWWAGGLLLPPKPHPPLSAFDLDSLQLMLRGLDSLNNDCAELSW